MRGRRFFATLACAGLVITSARAATLENFRVGNWQMAAYADDQSGQFTHCAMSASYSTGNTLLFAINQNFGWSFGILNQGWSLPPGSSYSVGYSINGGYPTTTGGKAITPTEVEVALPADDALYSRFKYGSQITVNALGQSFYFTLEGTQHGLSALQDCAQRHVALAAAPPTKAAPPGDSTAAPGGNAPTANSGSPGATPPGQVLGLSVDGVALVANILAASGITGFHLDLSSEVPKDLATYQAVWSSPGVTGVLSVVAASNGAAGTNMSGELIANDAKNCTGKFSSGTLSDDSAPAAAAAGVTRIFTTCDGGNGSTATYYTVLPRQGGGQYVFAEMSAGGAQPPAQDAENKIRQAAAVAIH